MKNVNSFSWRITQITSCARRGWWWQRKDLPYFSVQRTMTTCKIHDFINRFNNLIILPSVTHSLSFSPFSLFWQASDIFFIYCKIFAHMLTQVRLDTFKVRNKSVGGPQESLFSLGLLKLMGNFLSKENLTHSAKLNFSVKTE